MGTIPVTPSVVQDIVDNADERELWIVGRREVREAAVLPRGKGGDTRLARALRVCVENRIMPNGDGTYMVEGSEHRTYRVGAPAPARTARSANAVVLSHGRRSAVRRVATPPAAPARPSPSAPCARAPCPCHPRPWTNAWRSPCRPSPPPPRRPRHHPRPDRVTDAPHAPGGPYE